MTEEQAPDHAGLRVVIVDDHAMFRAGVNHEIGQHVDVVGEGEDVETAVKAILETEPDVVLLDVHLPGGGGEAAARSRARSAGSRDRHETSRPSRPCGHPCSSPRSRARPP